MTDCTCKIIQLLIPTSAMLNREGAASLSHVDSLAIHIGDGILPSLPTGMGGSIARSFSAALMVPFRVSLPLVGSSSMWVIGPTVLVCKHDDLQAVGLSPLLRESVTTSSLYPLKDRLE